jgi:hypothetical protein
LWHQMTAIVGENTQLITEADLNIVDVASPLEQRLTAGVSNGASIPQFSAIQSAGFNALLVGKVANVASLPADTYAIEINFLPTEIDRFFQPLSAYLPARFSLIGTDVRANDSHLQTHFTKLLLTAISPQPSLVSAAPRLSELEMSLQQQIAQAHLLNDISTQIHQNLDLEVILRTAIQQVQVLLAVDRLTIYQFEFERAEGKISSRYL